ncbi:hypothetical protein ACI3L1_18270 [Deinococcus sp. SM5_A1]|uniref:hypothetical protein n=1 Tax=Deinococcus sp. SM5_A1 TaxID=3379094 RepID=UPI00385CBD63
MGSEVVGEAQIKFPVLVQPGLGPGGWQVTLNEGTLCATIEFGSALELLQWLEDVEHRPVELQGGLR